MPNQYLPPVIQIPSSLLILGISRSVNAVVITSIGNTSTEANTYQVGMNVKLYVPRSYGMYQANGLVGTIVAIDGVNFTLNLNTQGFDRFIPPSGSNFQGPASLSPYGSRNLQYNNSTSTVPFQSLNNVGN